MRIDIHDHRGRPRLRVLVDPANPPSVVHAGADGPSIALDWNQAIDDEEQLRHCPVCSHPDLYVRRAVPQVTWFAAVVAVGIVVLLFTYGVQLSAPALGGLLLLLVADLLIWRLSPRMLACYRCDAWFRQTPIPADAKPWNAARAPTPEPGR